MIISYKPSRKIFSIILMAVCLHVPPLHAENARVESSHKFSKNNFVSTGYLYNKCKKDLEETKGSRQKFSATYCGAVFTGFLGGFTVSSFGQIESNAGNTNRKLSNLKKKILCLPDDFSPMKLASDFVKFIDTAQYEIPREKALAGSSFYGLQEFYSIYHCK